jgi:hypothetical protein
MITTSSGHSACTNSEPDVLIDAAESSPYAILKWSETLQLPINEKDKEEVKLSIYQGDKSIGESIIKVRL